MSFSTPDGFYVRPMFVIVVAVVVLLAALPLAVWGSSGEPETVPCAFHNPEAPRGFDRGETCHR